MLQINLPVAGILSRVHTELSFAQTDERRSRLYLIKDMLELAERCGTGTVSVDEELFRFLDL